MPAKYSHVKKRSTTGLHRKNGSPVKDVPYHHHVHHGKPSPHTDRSVSKAASAVSQLERGIARILLLRVALVHLPTFAMRCIALAGPGWLVHNSDTEDIKDFFRAAIGMDMRQAGERVATKSVLWSYTALRHFAMSNNVPICSKSGLHSLRLLECYPALRAHVDALEAMPPPTFSKPPHLGSLQEGLDALEDACELKFGKGSWDKNWRAKVRLGYERLVLTLWRVAREFDVRGYGNVLREKLLSKWCDCGCSTDHLGEVCERTVRDEEEEHGVRVGKQREWDGRGSGVYGWETEEEEDIWAMELDFVGMETEDDEGSGMTVGDSMEWRFYAAEREKEKGNLAFRQGDFVKAVHYYNAARDIEPELPHYQLNLAAAHLKLSNWMEAEAACAKALSQHRSSKGYYRRARSRKMLNRPDEAIKDLRAALKLQPTNAEALAELEALSPLDRPSPKPKITPGPSSSAPIASSSPSTSSSSSSPPRRPETPKQPPWPRTKADERRLKVTLFPASAAELALEDFGRQCLREAVASAGCAHTHPHPSTSAAGNGGKDSKEGTRVKEKSGKSVGLGKSNRMKEMEGIMKAGTVVYPSWDRYVVKRTE